MKVDDIIYKSISISQLIDEFFPSISVEDSRILPSEVIPDNKVFRMYFNTNEILKLNSFKTLKRQVEWMAGRLCIKHIITKKYFKDYNEVIVSTKDSGCPYLQDFPETNISITHSNNFALGAVSFKSNIYLGIDLEKIEGIKPKQFLSVAFSDNELNYLQDKPLDILYKNWTIKEAYLKFIQQGFHENIHSVEIIDNVVYFKSKKEENLVIKTNMINKEYIYSLIYNKY